ncbi:MAG: membrane fusion protein (multidrug efflux system) [Patiriisocius sp.]|jgi:multidrug efflux pump subunit AcrA (membrane-fusion protein)
MRKLLFSLLGLLLIGGSFFASKAIIAGNQRSRPIPKKVIKTVFVDTVQNTTVPIQLSANGNLVSQRRLELYSEVQGVLQKGNTLFKPGQTYRKGETLLRLNSAEYYATVKSQKSALYDQITAILPDLRLDYPDAFPKWQAYIHSFDVDKTTPELPEITSEKERYFISGRNILTSFFNVKNLEQRLGKYRITAPFTGILTEALVTEGTLVRQGQKLGEFIDISAYELEVAISKTYADLLKVGNEVTLTTIDKDKNYIGKVVRVNGNIDQASQTINAYVEVKGDDLREGVYLEAILEVKQEIDAISIPRGLLQTNNQLFVVNDTLLDLIDVRPVYFSEKEVVVKGVPDGTIIISKSVPGAYAGMLVKVYQVTNAAEAQKE